MRKLVVNAWMIAGALTTLASGGAMARAAEETLVLPFGSTQGITATMDTKTPRELKIVTGEDSTQGNNALSLNAVAPTAEGASKYFGLMVPLGKTIDLSQMRLLFDARTDHPENTKALYVRGYNAGERQAAFSFASWSGELKKEWRTFALQSRLSSDGLTWEAETVSDRVPNKIDRIEFITGTRDNSVPVSILLDNLRVAPRVPSLADINTPKVLTREIPLVQNGQAQSVILHPDSAAGRAAAARVADAIRARTGATITARVGTEADREPSQNAIILGNVDSNPALHLLYARYFTPVDAICPGPGGALVHTVANPFGKGAGVVVLGATDDAGLAKAADEFVKIINAQPQANSLKLTRVFERHYSPEFLKRFSWADDKEDPKRLEAGLKEGQRALDEGKHTSIAGNLQSVALRYQLTGHSVEAKLYAALWDLYAKSAVADPRKFGGPWGFDSDFPSHQVVAGWDNIEEDPALTDEERVRVVKAMVRWLEDTVIPSTSGNANHVPHNHQTFPALGALFAGLYFSNGYENAMEGPRWLKIADDLFKRQATYYKPMEDCNGYQWLTNGHLFRYAMARPDFSVFKNGNGQKIIDYSIGTMDNFGYQVPYGDTGSWQCWNSEMICLDIFAYATNDPSARWTANRKRQLKNTAELYSFYQLADAPAPQNFNGVQLWPLEMAYVHTFPEEKRPADAQLFDKISFRDRLDPAAPYMLLDGLSNGGHKHLDGNTIERITAFDRIWLADNDYFKAQVKYHNSVMIFKDGEAQAIPPYVAHLGSGETPRYGYSRTRLNDYTGVNWDRYVVWVKRLQAFVVLDKMTALQPDEYQFRLLWHGVGEATLDDTGVLLTQKGPSLRIQTAAGPELNLVNDTELGTNWAGYPHAAPVVRSMSATAKVKLDAGQSYMFATVMHGSQSGEVKPWKIDRLSDGIRVDTGTEQFAVALDSTVASGFINVAAAAPQATPQVGVIDNSGISLLGLAPKAAKEANNFAQFQNVDRANPQAATALSKLPVVPAPKNLTLDASAPAHPALWQTKPAPERVILTGNTNTGGALSKQAKITSDVAPIPNAFDGSLGPIETLLDGGFDATGNSLMFPVGKPVQLTIDLGSPAVIDNVRWHQWWATTSSKGTSYLPERATVAISDDNFKNDNRALGEVVDTATHANFGAPITYNVPAKGQRARYVRLNITPKAGSGLYLGEVFVEGRPGADADTSAYHFTRVVPARLGDGAPTLLATTTEGVLLALDKAGKLAWSKNFGAQLNDVAAADLNNDGRDEILLARQDHFVTVLDATGKELWSRKLQFYRRPPFVNLVRAGDIDGDGKPEVIAGGENWRFYAFDASGKELWNYEAVHPSRSGAVADLDGDGKAEVIAGTHYYAASVLGSDGTPKWRYSFGPISYDVATGSFDGDKTRGVIFGGGDGILHYLSGKGEARLKFNTGDEVRRVATADLNGDGRDEIFGGSMNGNLYAFDASGKRLWRRDLDSPIRALVPVTSNGKTVIVAGTENGDLFTFDAAGTLLATSKLGAPIVTASAVEGEIVVGTADGVLRRVKALR